MRSVIWFYSFWGLIIIISGIIIMPKITGQNDSIQSDNIFYHLDDNLQKNNQNSSNRSSGITDNINIKRKYPFNNGITQTRKKINAFCQEIDNYKIALTAAALIKDKSIIGDKKQMDKIIQNSSLDTIRFNGQELYRKDSNGKITISTEKDLTTYLFIEKKYGSELKALIINTRKEIIDIYIQTLRDCQKDFGFSEKYIEKKSNIFIERLPLNIDETWKINSSKNTWAAANFDYMPYAACMPILEKFKADARKGELIMVTDFVALVKKDSNLNIDQIIPIFNAKSCQVKKGEGFEAKVTTAILSKDVRSYSSIKVNGMRVALDKNGEGFYRETTNNLGNRTLNIETTYTNPLSGDRLTGKTVYEYTVTE